MNVIKFISTILLIALLSFASCLYTPWWSIAVVAFVISVVIWLKPYLSFLAAFVALLLLWGGLAWYISAANNDLLAHKMSLVVINKDAPGMLIGLTALIGGATAGFAALSGSLLRSLLEKR